MNLRFKVAAAALAAASLAASLALPASALAAVAALDAAPMPSLAPMVKRVSPAVVNIATRGTIKDDAGQHNPLLNDPFFRRFFDVPPNEQPHERQFQSAGSGVIVDARSGYIITNYHVVENASEITVTLLDNRTFGAKIIGTDEGSDLALLQAKQPNLVAMALGDSSRLQVGDYVVAIGNPFGLQHTVTAGIVSALGRSGINPDGYEDFIQTDASINPGNSGGALVNLRGELVGINSAILSRSGGNIGIGFAIPVDMVKNVMAQLIRYGEVKRGVLGVNIYDVTPDIAKEFGLGDTNGALVAGVLPGSAAERAGVKTGDIITSVNGVPMASAGELRNAIGMLRVGTTVQLGLLRDGKTRRLAVTIAGRGDMETANAAVINRALDGAELIDAPKRGGVTIKSLQDGSAAAQSGLRANDLIIGVGRTPIADTKALRQAAKGASFLMLKVRRGTSVLLIPIH
ncbi:MAG TPA: DegQ family serine endoprotease [Steroidobacteraceae bacterium]|nr:DegQ family serine endoprotease [Steroidobacteraceae bacterium]